MACLFVAVLICFGPKDRLAYFRLVDFTIRLSFFRVLCPVQVLRAPLAFAMLNFAELLMRVDVS
jgi:hypothetical protein